MGIINPFKKEFDKKTVHYQLADSKNLLLIFTRNPVLGKCKTRLAAKVGDGIALEIYEFLLRHTVEITKELNMTKQVYYSEAIWKDDVWDDDQYDKKLQRGSDLGDRMANAILEGFESGFEKICIIGSDMFDLGQSDIENAFLALDDHDFVLGPAEDGGYYLLGMKTWAPHLFQNKDWGRETVLEATMDDLKNDKLYLLPVRNDVDIYDDIKDVEAFHPFLKNVKND